MSILITNASSAEAYKLKSRFKGEVLLGDYVELPGIMLQSGALIKLPDPAASSYIHEMLALCLDKNISAILPLTTSERQLLKEAQQLFTEYGITIEPADDDLQ